MVDKHKREGKIKIHRGDSSTLAAERVPKGKPRN
jgi:hypothetical protein